MLGAFVLTLGFTCDAIRSSVAAFSPDAPGRLFGGPVRLSPLPPSQGSSVHRPIFRAKDGATLNLDLVRDRLGHSFSRTLARRAGSDTTDTTGTADTEADATEQLPKKNDKKKKKQKHREGGVEGKDGDAGRKDDVPSLAHDDPAAANSSLRSNGAEVSAFSSDADVGIDDVNGTPVGIVDSSLDAVANADDSSASTEDDADAKRDAAFMHEAVRLAQSSLGERDNYAPFPRPVASALLVSEDDRIIGRGVSTCNEDCVCVALSDAGLDATPLREWCVAWPADRRLREDLSGATLYVTLEPSSERKGQSLPPITQLIENSGIARVVIGCQDPVPDRATKGAATLHAAGISVTMGILQDECQELIADYAQLANSKLQRLARKHLKQHNRPLGFLHCSVIDSKDAEAFARNGNAFGKSFGGHLLSERDVGAYELAPPPQSIWAPDADFETTDEFGGVDTLFEEEDEQEVLGKSPMMPWYEQVDAVIATFPNAGNGPNEDDSIMSRLTGLKWLATHGRELPAGVERILVLDATDLVDLPLANDDPNLPPGVDVEEFWKGDGRRPTRILLRHASNALAESAARAAAAAAKAASDAAQRAKEAIESGDAEEAAECAIQCQKAAVSSMEFIQRDVGIMQNLRSSLIKLGATVETIKGGEPIDVMKHLGRRNGYKAVVWRAGCWGERGVQSILRGAFQWVSAHLAVDAVGGKFWQLMLAERAIQAACGPESKVKIFAEQEDFSLEYCDNEMTDQDCVLTVDGRPIRHVRVDCRVALVDENRPRELKHHKLVPMKKRFRNEEAPWFL